MTKQEQALEFATKAHQSIGQKRKYTFEDYINHPIAVSKLIKDFVFLDFHEDLICAALLHDVVEDVYPVNSYYSIHTIEKIFGVMVARYVEGLTDVYTKEEFPNIRRKERKLLECYRLSKTSGAVKTIKLADLIDNTSSIVKHDPVFAKLYLEEKEEMLIALNGGSLTLMNIAVHQLKESKEKLKLVL